MADPQKVGYGLAKISPQNDLLFAIVSCKNPDDCLQSFTHQNGQVNVKNDITIYNQ